MKYILILFVVVLSLGLMFWWWSNRSYPIVNKPTKPLKELKIASVGDSLVEGQGATNGNDFVSLLSKKWGVPIANYGIGGNTSAQVLARLSDVTEEKPDLVILLVGGNDALQKVPVETTFANIRTIIQTLQKNGSAVALIGVQGGLIGSSYQSKFEAVARETGSIYIDDILDGLIGDTRYMSDYVHPNNTGYQEVAKRVSAGVEKALE